MEKTEVTNTSIVTERKEKPNSLECGKSGNRFKIYFDTAADLNAQIWALESYGYIIDVPKQVGKEDVDAKDEQ